MSGIDSMTEFYVYENMQLLEQLEEILLSGQSDTGELSQEEIEEMAVSFKKTIDIYPGIQLDTCTVKVDF